MTVDIASCPGPVDQGDEACAQLGAALKKCDGQPSPPDFVTGEAASTLQLLIEELRTALGGE